MLTSQKKIHSSVQLHKKIAVQGCILLFAYTSLVGCSSLQPTSSTVVKNKSNVKQSTAVQFDDVVTLDVKHRHEKTLKNGLRIIVKEDHRSPVAMTQVWYKVGSTDEPVGKGGISHLLEHMMFKGTRKVSGSDFSRIVSRFGGQQNAFTSHDYTGYYQSFPAHNFKLALELEADRMANLQLTEKDFLAERQVVMEERRQRTDDNPPALAYEKFRYKAFSQSHQRNPVIGSMKDIKSITLQDLKTWYKKWYSPNNATLVVVGDVDPKQVFADAQTYFGHLKSSDTADRFSVLEPQLQGKRAEKVNVDVSVPTLYMAYNVPSLKTGTITNNKRVAQKNSTDNDAYALVLLADVLDGGLSARLETKLVREQKLLASVGTSYDFLTRGDSLFFITATPQQGVTLSQVEKALSAEIDALKNQPITIDEITKAKTRYVTELIYQQDSVASQARMIGSMATVELDDRILATLPKRIGDLTEKQLQNVAKKYLQPDNVTIFHVLPKQNNTSKKLLKSK